MTRRVAVLATLLCLGCGGRAATPAPQTINDTLSQFMAAVKANNLERMGQLWGTAQGPAAQSMPERSLHMRLTVIQLHLNHSGYRVVEGPLAIPGMDGARQFRVEVQRPNGCTFVIPIDLVRTRNGGWLVYDVHLGDAGNPARACG